ncbi:MAG: pantoate--beta-alanine ligase [Bacteroidales bacterium]|nr:pantoate--beta-alanine ligase [Bacteroidales bacterium]
MEVYKEKYKIASFCNKYRSEGKSIGFVPTMGALHQGHLSLLIRANKENDIIISSIFVNPTQFNNSEDYLNYPRNIDDDLIKLQKIECDAVFIPTEEEIYPEPDNRNFDFGYLGQTMEGKYREGHFNGVAKVITKLFDIIQPNKAYFGEKDYQQLIIIKKLVKDFNYDIEIVPCSIIREPDGLAMSSRNLRLSENHRKIAPFIYKILRESKKIKNKLSVEDLKKWVYHRFEKMKEFKIEYFNIVDDENLKEINEWKDNDGQIGCIAVWLGNIRLIDNIKYN